MEYRDYELAQSGNGNLKPKDELYSVEEIIGSNRRDEFKGSKFGDIFHGAEGDDLLQGNDGDDILHGDKGNDELRGDNGNDQLYGGDGDDKLIEAMATIISVEVMVMMNFKYLVMVLTCFVAVKEMINCMVDPEGEGNDYLEGGEGSDFYAYRATSGNHTIYDQGKSSDSDKLYLSDLSFDNLLVEKVDNNLVFKPSDHNSNRGSLTIKDWFKTGHTTIRLNKSLIKMVEN